MWLQDSEHKSWLSAYSPTAYPVLFFFLCQLLLGQECKWHVKVQF